MYSKRFSFTDMKGKDFSTDFNALQQETIYDKWKVSIVHIFSWDHTNCFVEKEFFLQDVVTEGGK